METLEKITVTLQSDCICVEEDGTPYDECFGCWEDSIESFNELISAWRKNANIETDKVFIAGRGMTWQRLDGHATADLDTLYKALTIRGDFRLEFRLVGAELTATRYSHDEPVGCSFTFTPLSAEDEDEE